MINIYNCCVQGEIYDKCTPDGLDGYYSWCATAVDAQSKYTSWDYCGYGNPYENECVPMVYSGVYYDNCTVASSSGWCATSARQSDMAYQGWKMCTEEDYGEPQEPCETCPKTITGKTCVPFTYGGELVEGCYGDSYSWCATEVDSSNSYTSWDYCGYGDSTGDECYFPFHYNNIWYTTCTDPSSGWCATSVYEIEHTYASYKNCDDEELALGRTTVSIGAGTTVAADNCVPMIFSGVYYEKCTTEDTYSWCATAVNDDLTYTSWQYCGFGDSNGDTCYYPFIYSGVTYEECAGQDTSYAWCATAVYENNLEYYSYKYCDESDLNTYSSSWGTSVDSNGCVFPFQYLGVSYLECTYVGGGGSSWCATSVDSSGNYQTWQYCPEATTTTEQTAQGVGKTMSQESCVPMNYGGVYYDGCTEGDYGWCATSTDSSLNYQTWGYCANGDGENCYFPFEYSGLKYECIQKESYSPYGWCATLTYTGGAYYDWKYCSAEEAGVQTSEYGSGTTVSAENCVPMTYGGVYYAGCTDDTYSWCATSTDSNGYYSTWQYCGYGDFNGDTCVYPFYYSGQEYYTCYGSDSSAWCSTSVYENTHEYYSWKYCDDEDLALGYTAVSYGEGTTIDGQDCVPMIYNGMEYDKCTSDTDDYSWCATSTNDDGSYSSWQYCGYGNSNEDSCVPMIYSGVLYETCTAQSTSGWCATSAYENSQYYGNYIIECDHNNHLYHQLLGNIVRRVTGLSLLDQMNQDHQITLDTLAMDQVVHQILLSWK